MFTTAEINKAKELSYENWENALNGGDDSIGFSFSYTWITNPFVDETARFEMKNYEYMCEYYGKENVDNFIKRILESEVDANGNDRKAD